MLNHFDAAAKKKHSEFCCSRTLDCFMSWVAPGVWALDDSVFSCWLVSPTSVSLVRRTCWSFHGPSRRSWKLSPSRCFLHSRWGKFQNSPLWTWVFALPHQQPLLVFGGVSLTVKRVCFQQSLPPWSSLHFSVAGGGFYLSYLSSNVTPQKLQQPLKPSLSDNCSACSGI